MTLSITLAQTDAEIAACMALRWSVFVDEQGVPPEDELDGSDEGCTHVIAREDDRVVGAARFFESDDICKIGRVCVDKSARGNGIGAQLIAFVCSTTTTGMAKLSAQTGALSFYERLGFNPVGDVYPDAGIPHQDMVRKLKIK